MVRALLRAPTGAISLLVLALVIAVAVVAPMVLVDQANVVDLTAPSHGPTAAHLLGTDRLGRDILARILVATRLSMSLAFAAAGLGALIGIPVGGAIVLLRPRLRAVALRTVDALFAFPDILIAIFVAAIVGAGATAALLGVAVRLAVSFARVSSSLALSIGSREYIAAARVLGNRGPRLLFRYILPNIAETLAIAATSAISSSILVVSSLSFLGLGIQPPDFDWGRMLTEGVNAFYVAPAAAVAPAVAIGVTALAFGLFGEALARAMNPVLWAPARTQARPQIDLGAFEVITGAQPHALASANGSAVLEVQDLTVTFPGEKGPVPVVDGISFSLQRGEIVGLVGESGSGKSMTSLAIMRIVPFPGKVIGRVKLNGKDLNHVPPAALNRLLGTETAVVFQDPMSSLNPALTIGIQLAERAEVHRGLSRKDARAVAVKRLSEVNLPTPHYQLQRHPHELSGGMRQRVMIAMGLMNEPVALIADEPTTALDVTIQAQLMDLLHRVGSEHGAAILLISHNIGLVSQNCQRVLVMYAGHIVEEAPTKELLRRPLHPYTQGLLAAVPTISGSRNEPLQQIPGQAPAFDAVPAGCPYHPRCPLAIERCKVERPPLVLRPDGRRVACWVANQDRS